MKNQPEPWTTIYFFEVIGGYALVRSQEVLTADLPRLSAGHTFWRESMPADELAAKLKARIGKKLSEKV